MYFGMSFWIRVHDGNGNDDIWLMFMTEVLIGENDINLNKHELYKFNWTLKGVSDA